MQKYGHADGIPPTWQPPGGRLFLYLCNNFQNVSKKVQIKLYLGINNSTKFG